MKGKIVSGIVLAMILTTFMLGFQCQIVQAYFMTPVVSGQLFHYYSRHLVANYGYVTPYDREKGTETNVYFFPAIESKALPSDNYFVSNLKITVTGTKPDGSAISGLEFCDLAHLISPQSEGTQWDDAFTFIWNVIQWIDPTGMTSLIQNGKQEGEGLGWSCGTGYDATSAWAWYDAPSIIVVPGGTKEKGLQFRCALHCDPALYGTYTLRLQFHININMGYINLVRYAKKISIRQ